MQAHSLMASDKRRDSQAYWEARLQRMGLGMERGHVDWIKYGHNITAFDFDSKNTLAGESKDKSEWSSQ